ncbi:hypothetical protein BH18VER1_BH18VER1_16000 [soil metagenome]
MTTMYLLRKSAIFCLCVLLSATVGCGSVKNTGDSTKLTAPQTGSLIARRVAVKTQSTEETPAEAKREKKKTEKAQPDPPVDDDYLTRGGFR